MGGGPGKCGYTLDLREIPDEIAESYPDTDTWYTARSAVCCWRDSWTESDDGYCLWHTDIDAKSDTQLAGVRGTGSERLDGATLAHAALGDGISFGDCTLIGGDCHGADLRGADLSGANLRSADLSEAQLWNADLTGAHLWRTDLRGANLVKTELAIADLMRADLSGARLVGADLAGANLRRARIHSADLPGANLTGANLRSADVTDVDLEGATLRDANLHGADLTGADLRNADLVGADLRNVDLAGADLEGAEMSGAALLDADLTGANLCRADMQGTDLRNTDLTDVDLAETTLRGAELVDASLSSANLVGVELTDADIEGADLSTTALRDADLTGANLSRADLTGADLSNANLTGATLPRAKLFGTDCSSTTFHETRLFDARLRDLHISGDTDFGEKNVYERLVDDLPPPDLRDRLRDGSRRARVLAGNLSDAGTGPADPSTEYLVSAEAVAASSKIGWRARNGVERWWYWYRRQRSPETTDGGADKPFEIAQLDKSISVYKDLEQLCRENGLPGEVPDHYIRRKHAERKRALIGNDTWRWVNLAGQRWIMKYGEGPWRIILSSVVVIVVSALIYPLTGGIVTAPNAEPTGSLLATLYFSIITFATLGYGDFQPLGTAARTVAGIESLLGALLIALLVAVSARRMMR